MSETLEEGDRFTYEPTQDDYPCQGVPKSEIPTETHEVVAVAEDGQLTTIRVDDGSEQKHAWPPIDVDANDSVSKL